MTKEDLKNFLNSRQERLNEEQKEKERIETEKLEKELVRFNELKEKINTDIELGYMLNQNKISIPFTTDGIRHGFGLYAKQFALDKYQTFNKAIGRENGGACGVWDIVYKYGDDKPRYIYEDDTYKFIKKDYDSSIRYQEIDGDKLEWFNNEFEKFHTQFHEWLNKLELSEVASQTSQKDTDYVKEPEKSKNNDKKAFLQAFTDLCKEYKINPNQFILNMANEINQKNNDKSR